MKRRAFLPLFAGLPLWASAMAARAGDGYPEVRPGRRLVFPRDHGSHPEYRTEWWYITGWADSAAGPLGVQVTFFRNRPRLAESSASAFAPRELLFAHAAIAEPARGRLLHDQRAARAGFGLARAGTRTTDVSIDDWSLRLDGADRYRARIAAREFELALDFVAGGPVLLQGEGGYSRKGPLPRQSSYYYSRPQLGIEGRVMREGRAESVRGRAWLDHEWSSEVLAAEAVGWDWVALNIEDGGALMAFRVRRADGGVLWSGGSLRDARGLTRILAPADVGFEPLRRWRSPRSGAEYPVAMRVRAGDRVVELEPLMDDQELDARASTGTIYWEGAVRTTAGAAGVPGRGYLELTGYWRRLTL